MYACVKFHDTDSDSPIAPSAPKKEKLNGKGEFKGPHLTTNDSDEDSEISFMDGEEFQEAILGKRKFDDTDSDSPTVPSVSKKEKLNGEGESKGPPTPTM